MEIKGIIVPVLTPLNEDESINEAELRNQVNRHVAAGMHGIFPFGTNGEGYILSEKEKEQVLSVVIDQVGGRIPVYAGTGCIGTKDTIRQSQMAKAMGADVLSLITPSFAAASQEEIYTHFATVAKAVDLPIMLYNIPARTGNAISPQTVHRLSQIDSIVGVKDSSGNFDTILQYIEQTKHRRDFSVLSGNDSLILWTLLAGGTGAVSGCANVYPQRVVEIYEGFAAGNMDAAREAQDSLRSFRNCFVHGNPNTIVKTAVSLLGYPVGKCKAPFHLLSEAGVAALTKVLEENMKNGMC